MEENADFRPPKKKRCTRKPETRFPTMSEEEMAEISKVFVPANTAKNTQWAVSVFREWRSAWSSSPDDGQKVCPADLLENPVVEDLNYWLARFVAEVRSQDGKPYTPRSIHQILCGLQRYMTSNSPTAPKILSKDDRRFIDFHSAVDHVYHRLRSEGVGVEVRHADVITVEEEEKLWDSSVLNITTPKGLQRAVFYYVGKCFCVRGGQEQRNLGPSNFRLLCKPGDDPHCVIYEEHGSKNHPGGD